MTREEFVCRAFLKYLERPEVMYVATDIDAEKSKVGKLAEAAYQLARVHCLIEDMIEFAEDEMEARRAQTKANRDRVKEELKSRRWNNKDVN